MRSYLRPLATAILFACSDLSLAHPVMAEADPAADGNGPIPNINALSAQYLPAYSRIVDGLSWAGHVDSEIFSNYSGGVRRGSEPNLVGQFGLEYDTRKAGLWRGGKLTFSVMGIYSGGVQPDYSGDLQTASNIWAPSALRIYDAAYRQRFTHWLNARIGITDINILLRCHRQCPATGQFLLRDQSHPDRQCPGHRHLPLLRPGGHDRRSRRRMERQGGGFPRRPATSRIRL